MSGKRGTLLPAGNAHIILVAVFHFGTVWVGYGCKKRCFWCKNGIKNYKKQGFLSKKWLKNGVFRAKMGVKRVKIGCNNRVFGVFWAFLGVKSVPGCFNCSTCSGGTVHNKSPALQQGFVGFKI